MSDTHPRHHFSQSQRRTPDDSYAALIAKLRRQILYAQHHSPFYQRKLHDAGVGWEDLRSLDDLPRLPLTTLPELIADQAAAPPLGELAACAREHVRRIYVSRQAEDGRLSIGATKRDLHNWGEIAARILSASGIRRGQCVAMLWPANPAALDAVRSGVERLGASTLPASVPELPAILGACRIDAVCAGLECVSEVQAAIEASARNRAWGDDRLLCLIGNLTDFNVGLLQQLDNRLGGRVYVLLGVPGIAPALFGATASPDGMLSFAQDCAIAELLHSGTEETLKWEDGATGELILSATEHECMPLLRYRTGLLVRLRTSQEDVVRFNFRITGLETLPRADGAET